MNHNNPFYILIDTNFVYFSIKNKLDLLNSFLDCFCSRFVICTTECVLKELENLGQKFKVALKILKGDFVQIISCFHSPKIKYADDCLLFNSINNKFFIIATCDKKLQKRIRKFTNSRIIFIQARKFKLWPEVSF
mmetsp:Transcript_18749/g.29267  ORF Transcript_18749/g.29267 Transcript_18749/m.29267 type:complete len:135 (+) Transcript_18749:1023-1427(+)